MDKPHTCLPIIEKLRAESIRYKRLKAPPHNCSHASCLLIIPSYLPKIFDNTQNIACVFLIDLTKNLLRNLRNAIMRCRLKRPQLHWYRTMGQGCKNLEQTPINAQASRGYRLHTFSTASANSTGLAGGDRIQATMVFEKIV